MRIEKLTPPGLTPEEINLYQNASEEGIYRALLDHPSIFSGMIPVRFFAGAACRESDERKRSIYIEGYVGGYLGVAMNAAVDPAKVANQAKEAKEKTLET